MEFKNIYSDVSNAINESFIDTYKKINWFNGILDTEMLRRKKLQHTNGDWKSYVIYKEKKIKKNLDVFFKSNKKLISFRYREVDEKYIDEIKKLDKKDWEVINSILAEKILKGLISSKKIIYKLKKINYFIPDNAFVYKFDCACCNNKWEHLYFLRARCNLLKLKCKECGFTPEYGSSAHSHLGNKRIRITDNELNNLKENLNRVVHKYHWVFYDFDKKIDKCSFIEKFSIFKNKIPFEMHRVLIDLQSIFSKNKEFLTDIELPVNKNDISYNKTIRFLNDYGVIQEIYLINIIKTIYEILHYWRIFNTTVGGGGHCLLQDFFIIKNGLFELYNKDVRHEKYDWVSSIENASEKCVFVKDKIFVLNECYMNENLKFYEIEKNLNINYKFNNRVIRLITTSKSSDGFLDFIERYRGQSAISKHFLKNYGKPEYFEIHDLISSITFRPGDILVVIRGGGDLNHPSFKPFVSNKLRNCIQDLIIDFGVLVVTGIGHATNRFPIDDVATYSEITPTAAAERVNSILNVK